MAQAGDNHDPTRWFRSVMYFVPLAKSLHKHAIPGGLLALRSRHNFRQLEADTYH